MRFFSIILCFLLLPFGAYAADMFQFNVSSETPASFFSNGLEGYYFTEQGMGVLKYGNKNSDVAQGTQKNNKLINVKNEFEIALTPDGEATLIRENKDYDCHNEAEHNYNCLVSNPIIQKIEVNNLTGKTELTSIDTHIEPKHNTKFHFGVGSKMYSLTLNIPPFDFSSFRDFNSLKCITTEDGKCENFGENNDESKAALLGFSKIEKNDHTLFTKQINQDTTCIYNEKDEILLETANDCISADEIPSCLFREIARIKTASHPNGFSYFLVDYSEPTQKDEIYFIDDKGSGYRIYLNETKELTMYMLNKTAAEIVHSAL